VTKLRSAFTYKSFLGGYTFLLLLFVYLPIVAMIFFSFNAGRSISFPFEGFSTAWYMEIFADKYIRISVINSLLIGVLVGIICTLLTISTGLVLRKEFRGKDTIFYFFMLGIIFPGISYGLGMGLILRSAGVTTSLLSGLPVHSIWAIPWCLLILLMRFDPELRSLEDTARSLGANEWRVFREVTLPMISPQVLVAFLFGFILSWGELIRSIFVLGGVHTIPLHVYGWVTSLPFTPALYALGTIIVAFSYVVLIVIGIFLRKGLKVV